MRFVSFPARSGSKKLSPYPFRRIRVGRYRVVYQVENDDRRVVILVIRHRGDAYRNLERLDAARIVEFLSRWRE
jgi:mRNA-degrading endonuclease RelE of RelBE toxin-antitoxin system